MPGNALSLELDPAQFEAWCGRRGADLSQADLSPAWRDVSLALVAAVRNNFDRAQAPDGTSWLPLVKPSAKRGGPASKPLRDTGLLMASYVAQGTGHVEATGPRQLVWGTGVEYAGYHQFGTSRIPAREQIGFTPELAELVAQIVAERMAQVLAGGA